MKILINIVSRSNAAAGMRNGKKIPKFLITLIIDIALQYLGKMMLEFVLCISGSGDSIGERHVHVVELIPHILAGKILYGTKLNIFRFFRSQELDIVL